MYYSGNIRLIKLSDCHFFLFYRCILIREDTNTLGLSTNTPEPTPSAIFDLLLYHTRPLDRSEGSPYFLEAIDLCRAIRFHFHEAVVILIIPKSSVIESFGVLLAYTSCSQLLLMVSILMRIFRGILPGEFNGYCRNIPYSPSNVQT